MVTNHKFQNQMPEVSAFRPQGRAERCRFVSLSPVCQSRALQAATRGRGKSCELPTGMPRDPKPPVGKPSLPARRRTYPPLSSSEPHQPFRGAAAVTRERSVAQRLRTALWALR